VVVVAEVVVVVAPVVVVVAPVVVVVPAAVVVVVDVGKPMFAVALSPALSP